ncbi:MAG: hypothetical protein H6509_03480 [Bryobacterales bacterium]|nr:hypothetical protein [Bryobacterales bacterium]
MCAPFAAAIAAALAGCEDKEAASGDVIVYRRYRGRLYQQNYFKGEDNSRLTYVRDDQGLWSDIEGDTALGNAVERAGEVVSESVANAPRLSEEQSASPQAVIEQQARFYALDIGGSDRLVAMDPDSGEVFATIPLDRECRAMVMVPRSGRLYILHRDADAFGSTPARPAHITEVDTVNLRILRSLPLREGLAFSYGHPMEISPDGAFLYIANAGVYQSGATYEQSTIEVVEIASGRIVESIPMPPGRFLDGSPNGTIPVAWLRGSPDGSTLWAYGTGRMVVVDTLSNTAGVDFAYISGLHDFVFHPDGTRVYVAGINKVSVIDTTTFTQVAQILLEGAVETVRMVITPDGFDLFVRDDIGGNLYRIETATNTVAQRIEGNAGWVSFMAFAL